MVFIQYLFLLVENTQHKIWAHWKSVKFLFLLYHGRKCMLKSARSNSSKRHWTVFSSREAKSIQSDLQHAGQPFLITCETVTFLWRWKQEENTLNQTLSQSVLTTNYGYSCSTKNVMLLIVFNYFFVCVVSYLRQLLLWNISIICPPWSQYNFFVAYL